MKQATPHARGSTLTLTGSNKSNAGYPACAGIDHTQNKGLEPKEWLPRMRGDRPVLRMRKST